MAVVNVKSTAITNRDATPAVPNNAHIQHGVLKECVATYEVATGDSSTSKYRMMQVPSNARISQLLLVSDDMGTATAADFGIYDTTENGGSVVDADFFSAAVSLNGGALSDSDITHGNAFGKEDAEKLLWEALGLTSDPKKYYDVVATLTADSDAGGTMTLKLRYV
jgi:hypothetical protein